MKAYDISNINILVLENQILVRKLLTEVFTQFGVPTVHSTADPVMAWKIFGTMPVDMIFCDWSHGLDGLAFLRQVRDFDSSANPYVPFVVVTAHSGAESVCRARDLGMTEFLAKPVTPKMIYSRIVRVIENNRPFIRASDFFGPDRRRTSDTDMPETDRRNRKAV